MKVLWYMNFILGNTVMFKFSGNCYSTAIQTFNTSKLNTFGSP
jgi:hypothetical protein